MGRRLLRLRSTVPVLVLVLSGCGGGTPNSLFDAAGYHVRDGTVYYLEAFPGKASEIEQADAASFEILDRSYATDETAVYLDGAVLPGADPGSFELLDEPDYSQDAGHVFLGARVLTEDVAGFAFVGGGLTKDSAHVYWSDGSALSDDPAGFRILEQDVGYLFTADSTTVHVNGNPVTGARPASYRVLGGAYGADAGGVFYFASPVPGAARASFEVLEAPYARDESQVYWMGKVIPGARPDGFVVLNADFECSADRDHAYYRDAEIVGFDPASIPSGATVTTCSETSLSHQ